jgi:hypothetical protein
MRLYRAYIQPSLPQIGRETALGQVLCSCFSQIQNIFDSQPYESFAVYSDYSGKTNGDYHTYSFLFTPLDHIGNYYDKVSEAREKHDFLRGELSFKKMGQNERMLKVVNEALRSSNNLLPGVLFNVCVDKEIKSLFSDDQRKSKKILKSSFEEAGFKNMPKNSIETALRITHFFSFLINLLLSTKHIVFWMSDTEDDFYPQKNESIRKEFIQLLNRVLPIYQEKPCEFLNFNTQEVIDSKWHRELVSLVDLSAAGINDILTSTKRGEPIKSKTEVIAKWLSLTNGLSLQKINIIITSEGGNIHGGHVNVEYQGNK